MAELLVVVTIVMVLAAIVLLNLRRQMDRGYDVRRKADLAKYKKAFEDYYNDNLCYPTEEDWANLVCNSRTGNDFIIDYIDEPPCDPWTKEPYLYMTVSDETGGQCGGYRLLAALADTSDPDIVNVGCNPDPSIGCGFTPSKYNYGIVVNGTVASAGVNPYVEPTLSNFAGPPYIVCTAGCVCNSKANVDAAIQDGCIKSYSSVDACLASGCNEINCSIPVAERCSE